MTNLSWFYNAFCYFMSVLNRVYRPCSSVAKTGLVLSFIRLFYRYVTQIIMYQFVKLVSKKAV